MACVGRSPSIASTLSAFLCHATEDKNVAERLAKDLIAQGIDTFYDDWDIRGGDSLRQRIDDSIRSCTHFIPLLTPTSLQKPWVNAEIDAGLLEKLDGNCILIPIRLGVDPEEVPPLLRGLYAPSFDDYSTGVQRLVEDMYGVSRKPQLGTHPRFAQTKLPEETDLSSAARSIAALFLRRSEHGLQHDPSLSLDEIMTETGLSYDALTDAGFELEEYGYVHLHRHCNAPPPGFDEIMSKELLFVHLDHYLMTWNPERDALTVAAWLLNSSEEGAVVEALATSLCWSTRRMNPAVGFLVERDLVTASENIAWPWASYWIRTNGRTRRWLKDNS